MGFWGSSLYANDLSCDVRDYYLQILREVDDANALQVVLSTFEAIKNTEEEPLLWFALADTQWKMGRLLPEVKEKALYWIAENGGLTFWENNCKGTDGWKKTLDKLERLLNSPQPKRKDVESTSIITNPWNIGDVYAYCFHSKRSINRGTYGKYIMLQKIGDVTYMDGRKLSLVQVFDKIFESVPSEVNIDDMRILPFDVAERFMPSGRNLDFPKLNISAILEMDKASNYPKKHLTFIGSYSIPDNISVHVRWGNIFFWASIESTLLDYLEMWENYSYSLLENESIVSVCSNKGKQ